MSIKQKMLMLVAGVGLLFSFGLTGVAAAPTGAEAVASNLPATAGYMDGASHPIAGNTSVWYKFNITGDNRGQSVPTLVTLLNGTDSGITFDVYSESQIVNWWDATPVGRGTSQRNNGVQSDNLTWAGNFNGNGVQYIKVTNTNPGAREFMLVQSQVGSGS